MLRGLRRLSLRLETRFRVGLALVAGVVFVAAVVGAALTGVAGQSAAPSKSTITTAPSGPTTTAVRRGIPGFSLVGFQIKNPDGSIKGEHCGLLADTLEQLSTGLMRQNDIGGYDGMLFRFASVTNSEFYMANVPIKLDIAWFDDQGRFVSSTAMEPCRVSADKCPRYGARSPYKYAIETMEGGVGSFGMGPGTVMQIGGSACS